MADPTKMAALESLAATGDHGAFDQARAQLGAQQSSAQQGMAHDVAVRGGQGLSINGTPVSAPAYASLNSPYENFASALTQDQTAYDTNRAAQRSAQEQYLSQVASARAAEQAQADQQIGRARAKASAASALSDSEVKAIAQGAGQQLQNEAVQQEGQKAQEKQGESKETYRAPGQRDDQGDYYNDPNQKPTAPGTWLWDPSSNTWVNIDTVDENNPTPAGGQMPAQAPGQNQGGNTLYNGNPDQSPGPGWVFDPDSKTWVNTATVDTPVQTASEMFDQANADAVRQQWAAEQQQLAQQAQVNAAQAQELQMFGLPMFERQAANQLNLRPDLGAAQDLYYQGLFPDMTADERNKAMRDTATEQNYAQYGFASPADAWADQEARRKLAGQPSPTQAGVYQAHEVAPMLKIDDKKLTELTSGSNAEVFDGAQAFADSAIHPKADPVTGEKKQAIFSSQMLRSAMLDAKDANGDFLFKDHPEIVDLVVAMYAPKLGD